MSTGPCASHSLGKLVLYRSSGCMVTGSGWSPVLVLCRYVPLGLVFNSVRLIITLICTMGHQELLPLLLVLWIWGTNPRQTISSGVCRADFCSCGLGCWDELVSWTCQMISAWVSLWARSGSPEIKKQDSPVTAWCRGACGEFPSVL